MFRCFLVVLVINFVCITPPPSSGGFRISRGNNTKRVAPTYYLAVRRDMSLSAADPVGGAGVGGEGDMAPLVL